MRLLLALLVLTFAACQRAESAEPDRAATPVQTTVAATGSSRAPDVSRTVPLEAAPMENAAPACGCGGGGGGCGSCGGSCGGAVAEEAPVQAPEGAVWTELEVSGMHCGGCARRIRTALAQVEGVQAVEVDLASHTVRVATASGTDARALAAPRIDALGYRVISDSPDGSSRD